MDPKTMALATLLAMAMVLVIGGGWSLLFRKAKPQQRAAIMPIALLLAFIVTFGMTLHFPSKWAPELWQTIVYAAVIAGLVAVPALLFPRLSWPIILLMIVGVSLASFGPKWERIREFACGAMGMQLLLVLLLRPLERGRGPASALPLAFALSLICAGISIFYAAIDMQLGGMLIILGGAVGAAALLGLFKFGEDTARGVLLFATVMLTVIVMIAAFYGTKPKPVIPIIVYPLMLIGPLAALVTTDGALGRSKWKSLAATAGLTLLLAAPAVVITIMKAPSLLHMDDTAG